MSEDQAVIEAVLRLKNELSATIKQAESDVHGSTSKMQTAADGVGTAFTKMAGIVGISFSAMWAASKIKDIAQDSLNLGMHIEDTSRKMNLSTDSYQKLSYMAKMSGADIDNMGRAFSTLAKTAVAHNAILGISTRDMNGNIKDSGVLFQELLLKISEIHNPTERLATSMKVFGMAGREVYAMASQGKDKLKELADETDRYGLIIDKKVLKQLEEGKKAQETLAAAWKVSAANLTTFLIPAMETYIPLLQKLFGSKGTEESMADAASSWMGDPEKVRKVALAARAIQSLKAAHASESGDFSSNESTDEFSREMAAAKTIQDITGGTVENALAVMRTTKTQNALMSAAQKTKARVAASATTTTDEAIENELRGGKKSKASKEGKPFDESYSWDKFYDQEPPKGVFLDLPERGSANLPEGMDKNEKALKAAFDKKVKMEDEAAKKIEKIHKKTFKDNAQDLIDNTKAYFDMGQKVIQIGNNVSQVQMNNIEAQKSAETEAVEHSHVSAKLKQKRIEAINKEALEKERGVKKEQQTMSEISAVISGAEAIMKGYAQSGPIVGTIEAVLMAAVTATEVASIASQHFAQGLDAGPVQRRVGGGGTDSEPAMLTPGEWVLRPEQMAALAGRRSSSSSGDVHHYHMGVTVMGNTNSATIGQIKQSQMSMVKQLKQTQLAAARYRG
jgi:hypothetical protein